MGTLVLGTALGFLMASVFVCAAVMMLFATVRKPPTGFEPILSKLSPASMALSMVIVGYPTWGAIGAVLGLLYRVSVEQAPGSGMGSPNLVYTAAVIAVALAMSAPIILLLRHVAAGVVAIAVAFIGVFGWFLPFFAA